MALNGLDELPEVRFEIPFILIGKSTMALNRPIMARTGWYTVGGTDKYFGAVSQTDLARVSFVSGTGYGFSGDTSICLSSWKRSR